MKNIKLTIGILLSLCITYSAFAAEKELAETYVYSTYFNCIPAQEKAIDSLVKSAYAPAYDTAVKAGEINGWGWMAHHSGGQWRRILHHSASSIEKLLAGQEKIGQQLDKSLGDKPDVIGQHCYSHDDYIWQVVAGNRGKQRGKVGISVYMECDINGESKADEIVKNHFSTVYDANIGKGKLTSWGWMSHVIGGKYRRLATMTADNYSDLLKSRQAILTSIFGEKANKEAKEFSEICTSHQDYLWDIQLESGS